MAHFTESCEEDQPHLIAHVETTAAPMADSDVLETIHDALAADDLLPAVHLIDTGYVDARRLLSSRTRYDIDLLGPTRGDYHRRRRENKGFAAQDFTIDWERRQAICPAGQTSANWIPTLEPRGKPDIRVNFASSTCRICPDRLDCIDACKATSGRRSAKIRRGHLGAEQRKRRT